MAEPEPVFFELSWSILSTIGVANVFFGILIGSVTNFTLITFVPIVTSAACAVANGLCFYAFYLTAPAPLNRAIASGFADILWLIQEAGLSMYSYLILRRILRQTPRIVFIAAFWFIMVAIAVVRVLIAVTRVRLILTDDTSLQQTVNHLHMAYFPLIAVVECLSAYFLLTTFAHAKHTGLTTTGSRLHLFQYLMRSTEVRLALLAVVGIMRAVTYSFQVSAQSATHLASQVDRFCYTLECLFPIIMYIDMLSSKVVYNNQARELSLGGGRVNGSRTRQRSTHGGSSKDHPPREDFSFHKGRVSHHVEIGAGAAALEFGNAGQRTSSQERIVQARAPSPGPGADPYGMAGSDVELPTMAPCRVR